MSEDLESNQYVERAIHHMQNSYHGGLEASERACKHYAAEMSHPTASSWNSFLEQRIHDQNERSFSMFWGITLVTFWGDWVQWSKGQSGKSEHENEQESSLHSQLSDGLTLSKESPKDRRNPSTDTLQRPNASPERPYIS
ncbi:hypothetical protein STEG23_013652 [Scotinomys teguina]